MYAMRNEPFRDSTLHDRAVNLHGLSAGVPFLARAEFGEGLADPRGNCAYRKPRPGPLRLPQGTCNMLHSLFCILLISNVLLSFGEAQAYLAYHTNQTRK